MQFLIDYAANDPECPRLFRAYLEEVVLNPSLGEEIALKIDYHLRNPDIRKYRLGPTFLRHLEDYSIYDQVFPIGETVIQRPFAPIPERYRPGTGVVTIPPPELEHFAGSVKEIKLDASVAEEEEEPVELEEEGEGEEEAPREAGEPRVEVEEDEDASDGPSTARRRYTRTASTVSRRSGHGIGMAWAVQGTGKYAQLFRRLGAIPSLPASRSWDSLHPDDIDRTGPDWVIDSWHKGRRHPPLGVRLETIVNFLADEDVDRAMFWEMQFAEVVSYLEWLAFEDDKSQLWKANAQTRAIFNDAVTKAKAHVLFEKHHYEPTPLEITKPSRTPLKSTRLSWMVNSHNWPVPSHNTVPDLSNLLPRAIPPRPSKPVNEISIDDNPSTSQIYDTFVEHEKAWWQRIAGRSDPDIPADAEDDTELANLAYIESAAFDSFSRPDTIGFTRTDPTTNLPLLPDDTLSIPSDPVSWARERGARRAGLQQMLRASHPYLLTHPGSLSAALPNKRPILFPLPASRLKVILQQASGPQWTPPALPASQLPPPAELDPFYTLITYRAQLSHLKKMREIARLRVEDRYGGDRRWTTLPRNIITGAPFVWRMVDPDVQAGQDLLKECLIVVKTLQAGAWKVPRELLNRVLDLVGRTMDGDVGREEWELYGGEEEGGVRYVDGPELKWLRLLGGGECVNRGNWTGRFTPDEPWDQYKLFLIFARRVQKLLDDPNPEGLFARYDAKVTVEELLKMINAGADSGAVIKCEFKPYDVCCWLDRMKESGHVRFYLDPICYGVIERPQVEFLPEHRVIWPGPDDSRQQPGFLGYVADWSSIIEGGAVPDISEGSHIWNFFMSLALRLGYTIRTLSREFAQRARNARPAPNQYLVKSLRKWQQDCARLEDPENPIPSAAALLTLRSKIITELADNDPMLAPGREHKYIDKNGNEQTALIRDHNWDWASPAVTGRVRRFWSIDRWPLGTGLLSDDMERAIALYDAHADAAQTYDPTLLDRTTDPKYLRPKLRPYGGEGEDGEKVVFRPGPAIYPAGDTRLQREAVEEYMLEMVHRGESLPNSSLAFTPTQERMLTDSLAVGLDRHERTWGEILAKLNPFSRPSSRMDNRAEDGKLPSVTLRAIPKSWDPQAEWDRVEAAEQDDDETEADEVFDERLLELEVPSVDVVMAGMGA